MRHVAISPDLVSSIVFMLNGFLLPTDIKWLQHKHVEVVRNAHSYLRLPLPTSKRHSNAIVTMPTAVNVYARMVQCSKVADQEITSQRYAVGAKYASSEHALKEDQS